MDYAALQSNWKFDVTDGGRSGLKTTSHQNIRHVTSSEFLYNKLLLVNGPLPDKKTKSSRRTSYERLRRAANVKCMPTCQLQQTYMVAEREATSP